jgi:hypothetical protein
MIIDAGLSFNWMFHVEQLTMGQMQPSRDRLVVEISMALSTECDLGGCRMS